APNLGVVHPVSAANCRARIAAGMPANTDARLEVLPIVSQSLPVITQAEIESEIRTHAKAVLHEAGQQPLRQIVTADAEIDRLRVVLNIAERQLSERRGRCALEGEGAEHGLSRFVAGAA